MYFVLSIQIFLVLTRSETPPGNLTDLSICKVSQLGVEYTGSVAKTESNVRCQAWSSNSPHKVNEDFGDDKFPFGSKKASKNYCRNPDRKSTGPWCYTMNSDLIDESCAIPLCSYSECRLTGPGMEYGGQLDKGVSGRKCLKWDKERKKVLVKGNYTKIEKFPASNFPDNGLGKAKKFCRNPDGDLGGPWCFVENDEQGYIEKEYCDIPFCYDPECSVFTKNSDTYMHYTDFNGSALTDIKFGIKLWDPDNINGASARLVLSVLALPLTGQEIHDLGIGMEIFISNKESALRYGNKDKPEYEPTPGILTSTNFTTFTLNWDRGFITFGVEGQIKPIFLAEMKTKNNLMGFHKDRFNFYSVQGTNVIWNFPFCLDDEECDVHTTTGGGFQQLWPLRQKDVVYDLHVHIRAFHSAAVLITPSPTVEYPYFKVVFLGPNGFTRVTIKEYSEASERVLKEIQLDTIVNYWEWNEFSISFFANSLQIYMKKAIGMHSLVEAKDEIFRLMRWFSVSSDNTVAHWSFFCQPPHFAQPPVAVLPECAINTNEPDYSGTQDITSAGLPCLPWSGKKMIPDDVATLFRNESSILISRNYCRDPGLAGEGQRKEGLRKITHVYRGMWKVTRGKKVEVALKFLKQEFQERHIKDYLNLIGQWAFLKSSAIVRLFGIAFSINDQCSVMEYFKLGPLDQYLRDNKGIIKTVDLIEATSNLASAIWHLKENDIVHGRIRCRKLMVNSHEENAFTVKLVDPGIHTSYEPVEIHWIPMECYANLERRSNAADVWAMATTLYEIFTYGKEMPQTDHMQTKRWYLTGKRLPQPLGCPEEIYTLMTECWHADPHRRKQPQEISRDVNQLLYQVYNSRKKHPYDTVGKASNSVSSSHSIHSTRTDTTDVYDLISATDPEISSTRSESSLSDTSSQQWLLHSQNLIHFDPDLGDSRDFSQIFPNLTISTTTTSLDSLNSMQSIFELDDNSNVVLKGRIGQGFYGDVFRGTLEDLSDDASEPVTVAVKKLKSFAVSSCVQDFEREISIMKTLKHSNIVEILGVLREPDLLLVMEFVPHGSLQSYLKINKEKLHTKQLLKYAVDISMGMDYLGKKNIVHRDLAARNILVVDETHVKISDFGLAQFMGSSDYYILKSPNRELPIKWYAPESLAQGKFSVKSDVWSYGVTLYEMFVYGEDPPTLGSMDTVPEGQEQQVLLAALERGDRFPCPEHCSHATYVKIMRPCWDIDPHERPYFSQIPAEIQTLPEW